MANLHEGHRERLRNEFRETGLEHFPAHKVLEVLLFYSVPRSDTNVIGHRLIDRFGSIAGVIDAPYELLQEVEGVGTQSATLIKLVSAVIKTYMDDYSSKNNVIDSTAAAKEYMRYKFLCETKECVLLACMGNNGKVIFCNRVANGTPETVQFVPSDIIKTALRADASLAVLAHNHPHGLCIPSGRDLQTTRILYEELKHVDVELIDHIIIAQDGVYSMKENGMFPAG